ncbi:MAG: hypothetical protein V2I37_09810 [Marinilabiliaceae bacterium]|jgi:hypothetical protein|nr:hypothetical protein [Marinilabiliaceae bacterium]
MNSAKISIILLFFISIGINAQPGKGMLLEKVSEPNEKAFTILKPAGWLLEGGIIRWDPVSSGGAANAIEAKTDFALKSDKKGTVAIHWLPDIYYVDLSGSYVAGMFREGSSYNGMPVLHKMTAADYLRSYLVPWVHKGLTDLTIVISESLPGVEKLCYELDMMKQMACKYSAALLEYTYSEDGVKYRERAFCIIQDMGPYTAGMWKNRSTIIIRSPENEFGRWEPLFHEIGSSVTLNPTWIAGELRGQQQRGNTMIKTMQDISRIGEEIQKGHAETNAYIHHQAYLNLTNQEDYVNPYTQEVETGSNQWDYRWVDDLGNVLYTDDENYNPNLDIELNMDGFRKSKVKRQ